MIYNLDHNFLFVHIPRTGGMSISRALYASLPESYVNLVEWRHRYGMEIQYMEDLYHCFPDMYKFTVIRNPWEIIESDYNLVMRDIQQPSFKRVMTSQDRWTQRLKRVREYSGFVEFVAREYLGGLSPVLEGGFYKTWCCKINGEDLGFQYILFNNLNSNWPQICKDINIPVCNLPCENNADTKKCPWSIRARDAIGDLCKNDIEKFGFQFHGTIGS